MELSDYEKVKQAFTALRKLHYVARMGTGPSNCCGGCMAYDIGERFRAKGVAEADQRAVYFSKQGLDSFDRQTGELLHGLYISWASPNPEEIISALKAAGLKVEWEGSIEHCIVAQPLETRAERKAREREERRTQLEYELEVHWGELRQAQTDQLESTDLEQLEKLAYTISGLVRTIKYKQAQLQTHYVQPTSIFGRLDLSDGIDGAL